jgi:hypothetical protein
VSAHSKIISVPPKLRNAAPISHEKIVFAIFNFFNGSKDHHILFNNEALLILLKSQPLKLNSPKLLHQ